MNPDFAKRLLQAMKLSGEAELIAKERRITPGPLSDPFLKGARWMLERLLDIMDFTSLANAQDLSLQTLVAKCDKFCREQCGFSRIGPPGFHERCKTCEISIVTYKTAQAEVKESML